MQTHRALQVISIRQHMLVGLKKISVTATFVSLAEVLSLFVLQKHLRTALLKILKNEAQSFILDQQPDFRSLLEQNVYPVLYCKCGTKSL